MKMNNIKSDFKKLIQEQVKTKSITREVDSPYAKYNSRGQLMCIVCGVSVKSKIIWQAHINKRSHKENLIELKKKQEKISKFQYKNAEPKDHSKRSVSSESQSFVKPVKSLKLEKPKGILKNSTSVKEEDFEDEPDIQPEKGIITEEIFVKSEVTDPPSITNNVHSEKSNDGVSRTVDRPSTDASSSKPSVSDALPEGFFDDPVADAKARNVEYRDKDAEEWESFLKVVSAAEVESQQIIAEDKEEAAIETQLKQADEQIKCLERIVELDKATKCQLSEKRTNTEDIGSDASSDEEFSTVIWRTKNSLI